MAVSIPQVVTEDRASGALVIDGSLRFDQSKGQYLKFTPSSTGNRRTQTLSVWIKNTYTGSNNKMILGGGDNASGPRHNIFYAPSRRFGVTQNPTGSANDNAATVGVSRDYSGWQHLVVQLDCTVGQNSGQVRIYINGKLQENGDYAGGGSAVYITDQDGIFNTINKRMYLGHYAANPSDPAEFDGYMSQYYWIDGLALGPKYFGYTDPLTGTWRPRKFRAEGTTLNDGTNWSGNPTNFTNGDNGFNGNLGNYAEVSSSAAKGTFTFPKSIKVENSITFWFSSGTAGNLFINDEATPMGATGGFHQQDIEFTGTLSSISLQSGSQPVLYGIAVDGIILESTVTQNLDFGTNGVYLPFDGNTPIGQDQSGKGNDYTPVNFGGSADITKATGALPILNTLGGTVARAGVFGSEVSKNYTTTSNTAAGSGYEFDQTSGFNPSLSFVRGATYTFDYTDSSSHPLRFSSTDPDSSVTSYTDGTNTSVSNTVKITVPHNAPDTLYYYCTSHNSMNGRISVTTDTKKADPYAWKNVLAISGSGSILDSCASINCTVSNKTSTDAGSIAYNSNSNLYSQSIYSAGSTNQYFTVGSSTESDFDATGDFCFEFWHYPVTSGYAVHARSFYFGAADSSSGMQAAFYDGQVDISSATNGLLNGATLASSTQHKFDQWNHHAITREGNSVRYFQNGVLVDSATQTTPTGIVSGKRTLYIGGNAYQSPQYWQDIRFYNGVAKYTSNFIPASTNPNILPDTPSGVGTKTQLTKITDGAVSFDGTGDYLSITDNGDFTLGGDYTVECFFNLSTTSGNHAIFGLGPFAGGNNTKVLFRYESSGNFNYYIGGDNQRSTGGLATSRWYHLVVVRNSNVVKIFLDGTQVGADISHSATISGNVHIASGNNGGSGYNTMTGFISNFRIIKDQALYTSNFTPPSTELTNVTNTVLLCCQSNTLPGGYTVSPISGGLNDGTIWSSLVSAPSGFESTYQAELMFNGDTSGTSDLVPAQGDRWTLTHNFGSVTTLKYFTYFPSGNTANGANAFEVNGVTVTPTSKTQGGWTTLPIAGGTLTSFGSKYTGAGDYVFVSAIEVDGTVLLDPIGVFGESKATNFNPFTTDINTVRGQEGACATLNPLASASTLSDGNLTMTSGASWGSCLSTISFTGGKYYWETYVVSSNYSYLGVSRSTHQSSQYPSQNKSWSLLNDGNCYYDQTGSDQITVNTGTAVPAGATVGTAVDADSGKIWWSVNGVWIGGGVPNNGSGIFSNIPTNESLVACVDVYSNTATMNFGQKPFKFPPPDGFQPLTSSTVRPDTVIPRPNQYVSVMTYSGTNNSGDINVTSTDTNFTPDFVWVKTRTGGSEHNAAYDSVRGANKRILPSSANTEVTTTTNDLNAFIPGGFTMNGQNGHIYNNGYTHVAWMWKAGGNKGVFNVDDVGYASAAAAGITDGTAALTGASVGTKQGFSIVKWTTTGNGQSFSHALSVAPDFIISKSLNGAHSWRVYHKNLTAGQNLLLDGNGAQSSYDDDLASVTSSVVNVAGGGPGATLGPNIAYCWHDVPGLQKFGSYGGQDAFVELGFRPALLIIKSLSGSRNWIIIDGVRDTFNPSDRVLLANDSATEDDNSVYAIDFLSNGFKIRGSNGQIDGDSSYIYAAWAEAPSFNLYGATSNAR